MRSRRAEVGSTPPPRAYPSCLHRHHATHARGRPVGGRRPAVSRAFDASVESVKRPEPRATAHAMPMERVGITNVAILNDSTHVKKKIRPAGPPSQTRRSIRLRNEHPHAGTFTCSIPTQTHCNLSPPARLALPRAHSGGAFVRRLGAVRGGVPDTHARRLSRYTRGAPHSNQRGIAATRHSHTNVQ